MSRAQPQVNPDRSICRIGATVSTKARRDAKITKREGGEMEAMWAGFAVCLALAFMSWRGVRRGGR